MDSEDDGFPKPGGEALEIGDDSTQKRKMIMNRRQHSQAKQQLNNLRVKELLVEGHLLM